MDLCTYSLILLLVDEEKNPRMGVGQEHGKRGQGATESDEINAWELLNIHGSIHESRATSNR